MTGAWQVPTWERKNQPVVPLGTGFPRGENERAHFDTAPEAQ